VARVKGLRFVKRVRSRGKLYGYFDTGQKDEKGKRIYTPIGRMDDPAFGSRYAAMLGHRMRRQSIEDAMTVPRLIGLYQKSEAYKALAAGTRRVYDIYLDVFAAKLPSAPAQGVEPRDITLLMDSMADRPGAANLVLGCVGGLYKWARARRHVTNEPTRGIERLATGEHDPWPEHLVELALRDDDKLVRLAVHLLYYSAQRISDVCRLRWSQVRDGVISLDQQKTDKHLEIQMHAALRAELAATPRAGMTIIASANGKPLSPHTVRAAIKKFGAAHGVDIVPHGLRKNAVNTLLEAGCSVAETAAISGQTLQLVEHYAKKRSQVKLAKAAILKWEKRG